MEKSAIEKGGLWKANFIIGGYISLLLWNTVLNVSEYITQAISNKGFTQMSFTYCFGNVIAFCTANYLFTNMSRKNSMNLTIFLSFAFFFLCLVSCSFFADQGTCQYVVVGLNFVVGYFIAFAQSKIAGIAGEAGNHEIVYYNFGTGLAGVGTNVFSYIFTRLYPTDNKATEKEMLLKQVYANGIVVIISLAAFWIVQYFFEKRYSEQVIREQASDIESALTEESSQLSQAVASKETDSFTMIKTTLDLLLGIVLLYAATLTVVAFFNIFCYTTYDKNINSFTIPTYSFFYNFFDTIGKFIPPAYLIQNNTLLQSLNGSRVIIPAYFYYILFFKVPNGVSSPYLRMFCNAVLGISNGYFTSSFFTLGASRFTSSLDKGKATYFSVLFLCIGVVSGSLINLLLETKL